MSNKSTSSNRSFFGLFGLRLLRSAISIVTLMLSAKYFGVSTERDFWLLAFNAIVVINLAVWGPINETFRTQFIFLREREGESESLYRTTSLLLFTIGISTLLVLSLIVFSSAYANLIAPNRTSSDIALLIFLLHLLAPSLLINQLTLIMSSILNAYNIFYVPEIAGLVSSILNIVCLLVLVPSIGIYSLVISHYLGLIVLLLFLTYQFRQNNINLFKKPIRFRFQYIKPYLLYALPFFLPYFFGQLNGILEKSLASIVGSGTVSILDYSRKFIDIPSSVLLSVLTTILVPILSQKFAQNEIKQFTKEFTNILQLGLLVLGTLLAFFTLASYDIMTFFYSSKNISQQSLHEIATISILYCLGVLSVFVYSIVGLALMSAGKGKIYATCGVTAQVSMMVINYLLYKKLGIYVFPVAWFLAHLIAAAVMIFNISFMMRAILKSLLLYGVFILALTALSYFLEILLQEANALSTIEILIIKSVIFCSLVISSIYLFKLDERNLISKGVNDAKKVVIKLLKIQQ